MPPRSTRLTQAVEKASEVARARVKDDLERKRKMVAAAVAAAVVAVAAAVGEEEEDEYLDDVEEDEDEGVKSEDGDEDAGGHSRFRRGWGLCGRLRRC